MTLDEYYANTFKKYVDYLTGKISREEAEDRVQNIFLSLFTRKEFCEDLIEKNEFDKYVQGTINRQPAQALREQYRQVPTVSLDGDNIDFLSFLVNNQKNTESEEIELKDFYEAAIKLLKNPRKPTSDCGFETVGELRQYILIQYARNGRTLQEIADRVGSSFQNVSIHYGKIVIIIRPLVNKFVVGELDTPEKDKNDLNK